MALTAKIWTAQPFIRFTILKKVIPRNGVEVNSGVIPALSSGECVTLTYSPPGISGNYMFRAEQAPRAPWKR